MPGGLRLRAYVSAADTVTISVINASSASITGANYSMKAVLLRESEPGFPARRGTSCCV
jgi:ribosomal protein L13